MLNTEPFILNFHKRVSWVKKKVGFWFLGLYTKVDVLYFISSPHFLQKSLVRKNRIVCMVISFAYFCIIFLFSLHKFLLKLNWNFLCTYLYKNSLVLISNIFIILIIKKKNWFPDYKERCIKEKSYDEKKIIDFLKAFQFYDVLTTEWNNWATFW